MQVELQRNELDRGKSGCVAAPSCAIEKNATRRRAHNEQTRARLSRLAKRRQCPHLILDRVIQRLVINVAAAGGNSAIIAAEPRHPGGSPQIYSGEGAL